MNILQGAGLVAVRALQENLEVHDKHLFDYGWSQGPFCKKMEFYYDRKRLLTLKSLISAFDVVDGK